MGGLRLYAVLEDEEILREYYSYKELEEKLSKASEKVIESGRLSEDLALVKLEEIEELFKLHYGDECSKILKILREYCDDEAYLMMDSYFSIYMDTTPFYRCPLKILYLYRKLRDYGVDVDIMVRRRRRGGSKLPRYLLNVRSIKFYGFNRYWKLLLKPRKGLRIDYPCDIKFEDESIVIVDKEALRQVLELA